MTDVPASRVSLTPFGNFLTAINLRVATQDG
jgi:hypothetical protein